MQISNLKTQSQIQRSKPEVKYRAFYLSLEIIRFVTNITLKLEIKIICNQLIRSVTSIGANIVEAKSSASKREFLNYFQIALRSSNESKFWLALLKALLPDRSKTIEGFINELEEIGKIIASSVLTMKGKRL